MAMASHIPHINWPDSSLRMVSTAPKSSYYRRHLKHGPPNDQLLSCDEGDLYIDCSSEAQALYAKIGTEWHLWKGPLTRIQHPYIIDRYVWCSRDSITWAPMSFVSRDDNNAERCAANTSVLIIQALKGEAQRKPKNNNRGAGSEKRKLSSNALSDSTTKRARLVEAPLNDSYSSNGTFRISHMGTFP